jgi:uncharacterized protein involved in oxidation of intracellular sulfur
MEKYLIVSNDSPYGNERAYNQLRLAMSLQKRENTQVKIFLMADAVACAKKGQKTPDGYYNIERMVKAVAAKGAVSTCGTCCEARGMRLEEFCEGVEMGSMVILTDWTVEAGKVLVF